MEEYFIQYRGKPKIFKVCKTVSETQKANRMSYLSTKMTLLKLGYINILTGNKMILIKKDEAKNDLYLPL